MAIAVDTAVPKIGELLLARNVITRVQLDAAIARQRTDSRPLGEILLADRAVTAHQLRRCLSVQRWLRQVVKIASISLVTLQAVKAEEWANPVTEVVEVNGVATAHANYDAWDTLLATEADASADPHLQAEQAPDEKHKSRRKFETLMKESLGEPAYIFLKGRYSGKADELIEGLRYTVRWRADSINVEFKYSF